MNALPAFWVILILVLGPVAGVLGRGRLRKPPPPRKVIYASNGANLVVIALITLAIDLTHGRSVFSLLTAAPLYRTIGVWSIAFSLVCVAISFGVFLIRARICRPPTQTVLHILPQSNGEKIAFVFLCVLTGVVEEFVYRGFVLNRLHEWFHSGLLALFLVSLSFALMHGIQDMIAISSAFIQAVVLAIPVLTLHSLFPSMTAHAVVDLFAGFCILPILSRFGAVMKLDSASAI